MNTLKVLFPRTLCCSFNHSLFKLSPLYPFSSVRTLFTKESLGIDSFKERQKNALTIVSDPEDFKTKMKNSLQANINNLVFGSDLKKMILLTETDEDLDLLHRMIKRYCLNGDVLRFQTFTYGPELMRVHYVLNRPHAAMSLIEDVDTCELFNQLVTGLLLLDLLYNNEMYNELIRMFHLISSKEVQLRKYPFSLVDIFMAACYKMNTLESYQEAVSVWDKCQEMKVKISHRSTLFFSMLAFKQNYNLIAMECLENSRNAIGQNIMMRISAKERRYSDVLEFLKRLIYDKNPKFTVNRFITFDTLEALEIDFKNSENLQQDFQKMKEQLIAHNFVKNEPLDSLLCAELIFASKKTRI